MNIKIHLPKIISLVLYFLAIMLFVFWSWSVWSSILQEQNTILKYLYGTGQVILSGLFVVLLFIPKVIERRIYQRRFSKISKQGLRNIKYISKRPDPNRKGFYIYKIKTYGIGIEKLLDNRDFLKYALRINFLGDIRVGKRDYINVHGEPKKFKDYFK